MKKKTNNGLAVWTKPEQGSMRSILLFGWFALAVFAVAFATGWIRDGTRTDTILLVILLAMATCYLLITLRMISSHLDSKKQWQRLSPPQQKEVETFLSSHSSDLIHYNHILPMDEFLCVYSKQRSSVLFHGEIAWIYTLKGKLPKSATAYAPDGFQVTNVDNYLVFHNKNGRKFTCYFGNETLALYSSLVDKTPTAIHGYSEDKRIEYYNRRKK